MLAESFVEHHPAASFTVLVIDAPSTYEFESEPFRVVTPYDIGLARREFHRMAMIYGVTELATAVKPWLLETLLC